jgi:hypothetical protein
MACWILRLSRLFARLRRNFCFCSHNSQHGDDKEQQERDREEGSAKSYLWADARSPARPQLRRLKDFIGFSFLLLQRSSSSSSSGSRSGRGSNRGDRVIIISSGSGSGRGLIDLSAGLGIGRTTCLTITAFLGTTAACTRIAITLRIIT